MPVKRSTSLAALWLAAPWLAACAPTRPPASGEPQWSEPTRMSGPTAGGATASSATDDDGDGITAWNDLCPDRAEDVDDFDDDDGCPDLDNDEDGKPDADDDCPEVAAATADGCPAGGAVVLADAAVEHVGFRAGKAELDAAGRGVLDALAQTMAGHPEVELIEVAGLRAPSERDGVDRVRAEVAARYLESRGVAADRLVVRGEGVAAATDAIKARVDLRVRLAVGR